MSDLDYGATIRGFSSGQKIFGRYTLKRLLGRGGMGVVWLVRDESLERDVAVKLLPELVSNDPVAIRDLKRETSRSQQLSHPHILRIYDFAEGGGLGGITMELVEGGTLSARRLEQPGEVFTVAELAPWVRQLCAALDYAHADAQIVHRDLKPSNLMLDAAGRLKIADFGISASLSDSVSRASANASSSGSPPYMSPQQIDGRPPKPADDIYALGATLYELLTGKPPFYSGGIAGIINQIKSVVPPSLAERRSELGVTGAPIPPEWEETIAACLAKEPADRPQSAGEVAERLGLGVTTKHTKDTKTEAGKVGRVIPNAPASAQPGTLPQSKISNPKSKIPLFSALAAGVLLLAGLGWYFGSYAPEQTRLAEIKRLENTGQATEAARLRTEKEKQDNLAREQTVRLTNARGGLAIRTTPSGAEVRVGAIALEKSPLTLKDQKLGKYPVRVRLPGYEDWSGEVEVKENEFADLDVALVRSTGTVALTSDPAGLEAEIRGQKTEDRVQRVKTPGQLKLPTGSYDLTFRRPGWPEQKQTVEVTRNQAATATAEFAAGGLELTSAPAGAEVWQNDRRVGVTPYQLPDTMPGRYDFELKLKGYKPATAGLTVSARQTARESVVLEKLRGPEAGQAWTIPDLNLTLQPIAPGTFTMGSENGDADEKPLTRVTLTQPFWLGKTEVTQREWQAVMGNNPSNFKGDDRPVENVSWEDAMEFCRKLTARERAAERLPEGYAYTLPTEAQWEYACRSGTTGDYAGELDAMAWYGSNSGGTTHAVGTRRANAWGLHDMHGNVWEWCLDWYSKYPGGSVTDPTGATSGTRRVFRGGGWDARASNCRSDVRLWSGPGVRYGYLGFRLALATAPR